MPRKMFTRALPPSARTRLRELARTVRCHLGSREGRTLPSLADYFRVQPVGGYLGWVGHDNVGDDAIHRAIRGLFAPVPLVLYPDIPFELVLHDRLIAHGRLLRLVVLGGGTLINTTGYLPPFRRALDEGLPTVAFGAGVRDPEFWSRQEPGGQYDRLLREWVEVLKRASSVTVRGPRSADILERHGLARPAVIGDPALAMCRARGPRARSGIVGLNLGAHDPIWGDQRVMRAEILAVCRELIRRGLRVDFVPMNATDAKIGRALAEELGPSVTVFYDYRDVIDTIARLGGCDVVIGQRLHAVILAAGSSVPVISLSYNPKCDDFMDSVEMSRFGVRTDLARYATIVDRLHEIEADYENIARTLTRTCDSYRHAQRQCARSIVQRLQ